MQRTRAGTLRYCSYKFHSAWLALLEASHSLMDKVDDLHGRYNGVIDDASPVPAS